MKTSLTGAAAVGAMAALMLAAGPSATADEPEFPAHGHVLLLGVEFDYSGGGPRPDIVSYERCVDIAANRDLPLNAQHEHVHFGRAGQALLTAGHVFIPTAPLTPFKDCESLAATLGF